MNLPVFLLLVFSHSVFVLGSSSFCLFIIVEETKTFPVNWKKLTEPVYTNIFLERELKGSFKIAPQPTDAFTKPPALCTLFCFVFFKKTCHWCHSFIVVSESRWHISPQKSGFMKPFVSEEGALGFNSQMRGRAEFCGVSLFLWKKGASPLYPPAPISCVLLGWFFRWA